MVAVAILDVTRIEPKLKHPTIFKHFDELDAGENFIIDNDHDPKPLYYQLLGERGNIFTWEYLQQGPQRWQVKIAKRSNDNNGETIGSIAAKDMRKAAVFKARGIDYSCGGNKTLQEAVAEAAISEEALKAELADAEQLPRSASQDFNKWKLDFLCDYISNTHHRYIKENAELISGLAEKVAQRHGVHHPELNRLAQGVIPFLQNLLTHIGKEEEIVFPAIKQRVSGKSPATGAIPDEAGIIKKSVLVLEKEHSIIAADLAYFRKLSNDYELPDDACNSYAYLYQKLAEMEDDLQQCLHVENNILFPRAIAPERENVQ